MACSLWSFGLDVLASKVANPLTCVPDTGNNTFPRTRDLLGGPWHASLSALHACMLQPVLQLLGKADLHTGKQTHSSCTLHSSRVTATRHVLAKPCRLL
jgi:hypothetical protein